MDVPSIYIVNLVSSLSVITFIHIPMIHELNCDNYIYILYCKYVMQFYIDLGCC